MIFFKILFEGQSGEREREGERERPPIFRFSLNAKCPGSESSMQFFPPLARTDHLCHHLLPPSTHFSGPLASGAEPGLEPSSLKVRDAVVLYAKTCPDSRILYTASRQWLCHVYFAKCQEAKAAGRVRV